MIAIYDCNIFFIQATGVIIHGKVVQASLMFKSKSALSLTCKYCTKNTPAYFVAASVTKKKEY